MDLLDNHPEATTDELLAAIETITFDNRDPIADREILRAATHEIRSGNRSAARRLLTGRRVYREEQQQQEQQEQPHLRAHLSDRLN